MYIMSSDRTLTITSSAQIELPKILNYRYTNIASILITNVDGAKDFKKDHDKNVLFLGTVNVSKIIPETSVSNNF